MNSSFMNNHPAANLDAIYNRTDQFGRRIRTEEELKHTKIVPIAPPPSLVTHVVDDDEDDVVLVSDSSNCTVLLIEDLPSFTTEQDIMKMFSDFTLLHIVLVRKPKLFQAYVKFLNKEDTAIALKVKYNHRIGHKQVLVSECTDQRYEKAKAEFSIDPLPLAQASQDNHNEDDRTRRSENSNESTAIKYPRSQLFQKQFVEPTMQSTEMSFGTGNDNSNVMNANFNRGPPPNIDTAPNKFATNNSDPRRRKQYENHQAEQQPGHSEIDTFPNHPTFGESHQNTRFGEPYQNTEFQNESQHNTAFDGPPQFHGYNASFQNFGNNQPKNTPFNRPNHGNNMNRSVNVQHQRPGDPRQRKNPFLQPTQDQQAAQPETIQQQIPIDSVDTPYVFLKNIDFHSSVQEIRDWIAEVSVYPKEIYRLVNFRGLPNGKCVFLCNSPQEANQALSKDRLKFRSRVVNMNLMPIAEAVEALATLGVVVNPNDFACGPITDKVHQLDDMKPIAKNMFGQNKEPEKTTKKVPNHKNPFMRTPKLDLCDDDDIATNDSSQNITHEEVNEDMNGDEEAEQEEQEEIIGNDEEDGDGEFENINFVDNDDGNNYQDGQQQGNGPMLNNFDNGPPFNRNSMMPPNMQNFNHGGNNMMMNHGVNPNMHNNHHPHPSQRNTNGCVVALRNVPFQANAIDIMRFFHNFQLCPDDIIRRYRDDGSPTGDARVCFASPMDARAAVEQYQNGCIMNRIVHMRLFS